MILPSVRGLAPFFVATAAVAIACGGSTASSGDKHPITADAGRDSPGTSCNGAALVPPVVTVVDATTSELICGATVVAVTDAGATTGGDLATPCTSDTLGCPSSVPDGGNLSCILSVTGAGRDKTVAVSASGYLAKIVSLSDGLEGCGGGGTEAVTVSLQSIATDCGAIALVPPTLVARDAVTGAILCDPTVTTEGDGGMTYVDSCGPMAGGGTFGGCPSTPPDGGTLACVFVLSFGSTNPPNDTIIVSAPGYEPTSVSGVMSGFAGCVAMPTQGTQVEVSLTPLPADAGTGDAAHD